MNPVNESTPLRRIDQRLLDRLVDGELSEEEQRDVLRHMDGEAGSWRRLALAFVEGQSLGRDFRELLGNRSRPQTPSLAAAPPSRVWTSANIMLAACCVGLISGVLLTWRQMHPDGSREGVSVVQQAPALESRPQVVRVSTGGPGQSDVEVPLVNVSEVNPDWLNSRSGIPADVREALLESGQEFEESRRLIPFQLEDGRWGVIPVDEVRFVDRPEFQ